MAVEQAYKATVALNFVYIAENTNQNVQYIEPERISYIIIDHEYDNTNILPIVYISLRVKSSMYSDIMNTSETSKFHLTIKKKNALSATSVETTVVDDDFSYVTSSTNANYTASLNDEASDGSSYKGITVGLVSSTATNLLRRSFSGIYKNTSASQLISQAVSELPNLVMEQITYDKEYSSILIPPSTTIYKFLNYLFTKDPFYDSMFTLYMDFNTTYLISSHAQEVEGKDGMPTTIYVNIKDYTAAEAFTEGFEMQNGACIVYVNASNTNVVANNATEKIANNLVGYSDDGSTQNLTANVNNSSDNTTKTVYLRTRNAAAIKNSLQSSAVTIDLVKQNLNTDIFTPNKVYIVSNYSEYDKYDGRYTLASKKEVYYQSAGNGEFIVTCSVELKIAQEEEIAGAISDNTSTARKTGKGTYSLKRKSSNTKSTTTKGTRTKS